VPGNGVAPEPTATPTSTPTQSPATPTPTPVPSTLSPSATGYKVKGLQKADLSWSGATSGTVDIYRDGTRVIEGTSNDGSETDNINLKGGGTYEYRVCEADSTTNCSNTVTVAF
jgi:thermitase